VLSTGYREISRFETTMKAFGCLGSWQKYFSSGTKASRVFDSQACSLTWGKGSRKRAAWHVLLEPAFMLHGIETQFFRSPAQMNEFSRHQKSLLKRHRARPA